MNQPAMRVLCVTPSLRAGGEESQTAILLPGLRRRGIDARLLALDFGGPFVAPLREAGVPLEVLGMRHQLDLAPLARSPIVRAFAPEVILSRSVSGAYVGHLIARWRGAGHVFNDHIPVGVPQVPRRVAMLRLLAPRFQSVVIVSEDQRPVWLERGASSEQIVLIPNGVEARSASGARAEVRRELGLPDTAVVAVAVSSLRPAKRVPDFVRAVRKARERRPELIGVIVGDGAERSAVERAADGDPAIHLLGERDDVPRILEAADMLVNTSATEAMPMAMLEAMAAGLPVLATEVNQISDLVVDGETGVLVPPANPDALADELVALAGDPDRRCEMGCAGHRRCVERWGAERMIDSYLDVLERARSAATRRPARQSELAFEAGGAAQAPEPRGAAQAPEPRGAALASAFLRYLDRRRWVTWERTSSEADVLTVTNAWPDSDWPSYAPFIRVTVDRLADAGVNSDLVYIRGYKGQHVYLMACVAMALLPLTRRGKYRLVHSHGGETAIAARCFWAAPVLGTYWGVDLLGPAVGGRATRLKFLLTSRLMRLQAPLMSATTTKTREMERVLPKRARRRNWVIPDGIDDAQFVPADRLEARSALAWAPEDHVVITVSRRSPEKRVWLAEEAAELAAREIPDLRWRLVTGVPPEDMPLYYNAADVLLHTAAAEGSPNAIKEALACNLPVVATEAGDIAEVLEGVEPSALCAADPQALAAALVCILRQGRRSNGRERIAPLRAAVATARTLECYRSLGAPAPAPARAPAPASAPAPEDPPGLA